MSSLPIVLDNGTGYTKMGYAGNIEPSFVVPTCIAVNNGGADTTKVSTVHTPRGRALLPSPFLHSRSRALSTHLCYGTPLPLLPPLLSPTTVSRAVASTATQTHAALQPLYIVGRHQDGGSRFFHWR